MEPTFVISLPAPEHALLQELYAYWLGKRGQRIAPPRSVLNPGDIPRLLPNILLLDVVGEQPPRFRSRVFGTALVAAYGEEITGKFAEEIDLDDVARELVAILERAVRDCAPQSLRAEYTKQSGRHLKYEELVLPLSEDGRTVNMLLCGFAVEKAYG